MNKEFWSVYVLECVDTTFYTGITNDVPKRIKAHNLKKGAKYTRGKTPVKLVYSEQLPTRSDALKREHEIKKLSRDQKLSLIYN
ncbi:GIY-YIG nuclease family protein [Patescibacteria group bacterium]